MSKSTANIRRPAQLISVMGNGYALQSCVPWLGARNLLCIHVNLLVSGQVCLFLSVNIYCCYVAVTVYIVSCRICLTNRAGSPLGDLSILFCVDVPLNTKQRKKILPWQNGTLVLA